MNHETRNDIVNFIWRIADDVLRDVCVRGKYRNMILPMTVLRRPVRGLLVRGLWPHVISQDFERE